MAALLIGAAPCRAVSDDENDMLAAASVSNGHGLAQVCSTCHSFDKGGPNGVGPNLFGIVGAHPAAKAGYSYSSALQKKSGDLWTTDNLDRWLKVPGAYAPGTKMAFGGLLDPQDRADVIAYLMTLK